MKFFGEMRNEISWDFGDEILSSGLPDRVPKPFGRAACSYLVSGVEGAAAAAGEFTLRFVHVLQAVRRLPPEVREAAVRAFLTMRLSSGERDPNGRRAGGVVGLVSTPIQLSFTSIARVSLSVNITKDNWALARPARTAARRALGGRWRAFGAWAAWGGSGLRGAACAGFRGGSGGLGRLGAARGALGLDVAGEPAAFKSFHRC